MDVVYPLKRSGGTYRELRYSMRSLRNLPHDRVFVVGGKPGWLTNATHLESVQQSSPFLDSNNNMLTACLSDQVSDPFVWMNDDFFVTEPIDSVPTLNRGSVRSVVEGLRVRAHGAQNVYVAGMIDTLRWLECHGYVDPLSFELHTPLVVHKSYLLGALRLGDGFEVWNSRTAYGALAGLTGETVADVKVHGYGTDLPTHLPFLSTLDESFNFGHVGHVLRSRFAEQSQYEV